MKSWLRKIYRDEGIPVPREHPEQDFQIELAQLLDWALPPDYWYTAIDHTYHGERRGATLRRMGVKTGLLDMLIFGPDRFVGWLENKSLSGTLTSAQRTMIPIFNGFGHRVAICRSIDDAKTALNEWGIPLNTEKTSLTRIRAGFTQPHDHTKPDWPESDQIGRRKRR